MDFMALVGRTVNQASLPPTKVAAAIVVYFADETVLEELIAALAKQVDALFVISNGASPALEMRLSNDHRITTCHRFDTNPGLGFALNDALQLASDHQCTHLCLFDQDSTVPESFIENMLGQLQLAKTRYASDGSKQKIAAIGPAFLDARQAKPIANHFRYHAKRVPIVDVTNPVPVDCLITSGMLLNLMDLHPLIPFDVSYFVDHVDSEWCFRVGAQGYAFFGAPGVRLGHRLSDHEVVQIAGLTFLRYSPIRRYWFYKNSVRLIKSPYPSFAWKLRFAAIMLVWFIPNVVFDPKPWASFQMMVKGIASGLHDHTVVGISHA